MEPSSSGKPCPQYSPLILCANPDVRFEAFDEPWKVIYNTPGEDWEDRWGLMDSARNLKPGLTIPNCGGKTAT